MMLTADALSMLPGIVETLLTHRSGKRSNMNEPIFGHVVEQLASVFGPVR
jgi:hypothetical protein